MEEFKERLKQFWNIPISLKALYFLLFLTFGDTIVYFLLPIINSFGLSNSAYNLISIFWIIGIYFCLSLIFKAIRLIDIVAYLAVCSFYYLSPTIYPMSRIFVESTFSSFALNKLPFYFLALMINFHRDKNALAIISKLQLVMTAFFVLLSLVGLVNISASRENMASSYAVLFPTMFLFYIFSRTQSKIDLIFFILGVFLILVFGTRGPLLCLIIYLLVYLFHNYKHNTVVSINILLGIGFVYIFLRPIVLVLMFLTKMVGLSTRIFESFLDEELFNYESSSGRDEIHELLWNYIINDQGGIGYGLGSDRLMGRTGTEYAHNIVYEIWMDFGIYFGSLLLFLLALLFVFSLKKAYRSEDYYFLLILFVFSIIREFLSSSYLQDYQFYFFIGFCVNILRSHDNSVLESNDENYFIVSTDSNIDTPIKLM